MQGHNDVIAEYAQKVTSVGLLKCVGCGSVNDDVALHVVTDDPLGPAVGACSIESCYKLGMACRDAWLAQSQFYPCVHQPVLVERTVPRQDPYEIFTVTHVVYSVAQKRYLAKVHKDESEQVLTKHIGLDQFFALNPEIELVLQKNQFISQGLVQDIHHQVTHIPWDGAHVYKPTSLPRAMMNEVSTWNPTPHQEVPELSA